MRKRLALILSLPASTLLWAGAAFAISLGEMADEAGEDLETLPFLISVIFYVLGLLIVGFGLLRLKRHVDHPGQTTIGSGLMAVVIGAALIATPAIIEAVAETFGADSGASLERPDFD